MTTRLIFFLRDEEMIRFHSFDLEHILLQPTRKGPREMKRVGSSSTANPSQQNIKKHLDERSMSRATAVSASRSATSTAANGGRGAASAALPMPPIVPYDELVFNWAKKARLPPGDRASLLHRQGATLNKLNQLSSTTFPARETLLRQIGSKIAELESIQARPVDDIVGLLTSCSDPQRIQPLIAPDAKLEILFGNRSESFFGRRAVTDELCLEATSFGRYVQIVDPSAGASTWRASDDENEVHSRVVFAEKATLDNRSTRNGDSAGPDSDPSFCIHDLIRFAEDSNVVQFVQRALLIAGTAESAAERDLTIHFGLTSILQPSSY